MPRIYADLPKFKRVHQALMETARQYDVAIREIDKALAGNRTASEKAALKRLRKRSEAIKKKHLDTIRSFIVALEDPA